MAKAQNDDILKAWTESQKRLWESFSSILPPGQSPPDMATWQHAYQQNLSLWEATVKQTLTNEATLLEQWTKNFAREQNKTHPLGGLSEQIEGAMRHWLRSQAQIWDDCFAMLRGGKDSHPADADSVKPEPEDAWQEPVETVAEPHRDDLKTITGIGPMLERKLNAEGIINYQQIATLSDADIARLEGSVIRFAGRIRRDRWIEQAKAQHQEKYHESL